MQASQINALMLGYFQGGMQIGDLLRYGDFGLGTFDQLDGEMIVLDGTAWQAQSDGTIAKAGFGLTTPFAVVTPFEADARVTCPEVQSLTTLERHLDTVIPDQNLFHAIRIEVQLEAITLRSVPRQAPPYRPLADVTKEQRIWSRTNVAGTLVGFRCPKWVGNLNVPGYHWHFLSSDRKLGGHVFDLRGTRGILSYDQCGQWLIVPNRAIATGTDLTKDLSHDLEEVEKRRGGLQR